jgi:hypothetical protein
MEMRKTEITQCSPLDTEVAKSFNRANRRCHFASRVPVNKVQLDTALSVACKADLAERRAIGRHRPVRSDAILPVNVPVPVFHAGVCSVFLRPLEESKMSAWRHVLGTAARSRDRGRVAVCDRDRRKAERKNTPAHRHPIQRPLTRPNNSILASLVPMIAGPGGGRSADRAGTEPPASKAGRVEHPRFVGWDSATAKRDRRGYERGRVLLPGKRRAVVPLMLSLSKDDGEAADRRRGERNGQLTPRA